MNAKKTSHTGKAGKPRNKPPDLKGLSQPQRFVETAKALGADESGKAFEKVIGPALKQNSFIVPSIVATQMDCAELPKEKTVVIIKNKKLNDRLFRRA